MKQVIVIPARMSGTRLPGKPLIKIKGIAMIERVWNQCKKVKEEKNIFVATEDNLIKEFCDNKGIQCVNTGKAPTAIDRVKLFSDQVDADSYINVQGDEPIVNPEDINSILKYNTRFPKRVVFGKTRATKEEFNDYSKAKVVCSRNGKLLYCSRAGIPLNNKGNFDEASRAIWIYAFNKESLNNYFDAKGDSTLEEIEDTEILRFLEINIPVYCIDLIGDSWAVDEYKDLKEVEKRLENFEKFS
tara:strand:+ start:3698 stop:4429 length:732 start_codon:yes stop_codon:yes gene_type:complete